MLLRCSRLLLFIRANLRAARAKIWTGLARAGAKSTFRGNRVDFSLQFHLCSPVGCDAITLLGRKTLSSLILVYTSIKTNMSHLFIYFCLLCLQLVCFVNNCNCSPCRFRNPKGSFGGYFRVFAQVTTGIQSGFSFEPHDNARACQP